MQRIVSRRVATAAMLLIATTGCQSAMSNPESSATPAPPLPEGSYTNVGAPWPLKFRAHYFGVSTYSTYGCKVVYAGMPRVMDRDDELQSSSEAIGSKYPNNMKATWGPISNFPPAAKVTWRSKDGTPHEAEIDIGEIFKDQLIRHNVKQEDAADPASSGTPGIILEVNDRTINVYMQTAIWLKQPKDPDNPLSDVERDLTKVFSQKY
ncbi:hypothetical protein [Pseudoxanthomonas dokdonensis]|uniref:hypothetical protein n=1 Tax=Pseudoxanthomonas dokdonensis TaxID=344882 RepID=UPI000B1B6C1E|nr:hypothetical protein [Pseudoxanthomonas dokdonensis]